MGQSKELSKKYVNVIYRKEVDNKMYAPEVIQSRIDFEAGYTCALEKVKEYLFNTENHPENISEAYLRQTIEFLLDED